MPNEIVPQQPQQPQTPEANDAAISGYAKGFLADLETNTDPDQSSDYPAPKEEAPPQSEEAEAEAGEAETPSPVAEVPMVEVEIDGEMVKVPEKIKGRLMADKDYRQKTMEIAAVRKNFEQLTATAQQIAAQAQQMAPYHAQLFQMDSRAQLLTQALQSRELADDPLQYNRVQGELAILLRNRDAFANGLQQQQSHLNAQFNQLRSQKLAAEAPEFFKQFPEIAKAEVREKLSKYVQDEGLPPEAIEYLNYSTVGTKLVWKAHQYDQMVAEQATQRAKLAEKVKTLPAASTSRAADTGAKDKQLREQWKKGGGSINDPAFTELLRSKLNRR